MSKFGVEERNKLNNKQNFLKYLFADCCDIVEVYQPDPSVNGAHQVPPEYLEFFTTYTLQQGFTNGKAYYTSQDGTRALAYGAYGDWELQDKSTG